jgi:hypothetical protein
MNEGTGMKSATGIWQNNRKRAAELASDLAGPVLAGPTSPTQPGLVAVDLGRIPEQIRASTAPTPGVYDARRLRSQREIIRDVMLSAAECETWLTLGELRALTRYGEASISAQLRHLRKSENGGYDVAKRHREGASLHHPGADGRGECVWEYRIVPEMSARIAAAAEGLLAPVVA